MEFLLEELSAAIRVAQIFGGISSSGKGGRLGIGCVAFGSTVGGSIVFERKTGIISCNSLAS